MAEPVTSQLSWGEAEQLFPGCGVQWDAQRLTDHPVVLYVNALDGITAATVFDVDRPLLTTYWSWSQMAGCWR